MDIRADLERARRDGVKREENLPFLLWPDGKPRAAVVLVHGFTASPWEMRDLGEFLAAEGYLCLGVRLPGHGTRPEDLLHRHYEEWREEVSSAYFRLAATSLPVCGVGLSTGGLLLASSGTECSWKGLVLLSPYLRLRHRLARFACLIRYFQRYQERPTNSEDAPFYYRRRPVNGICQLIRLAGKVRKIAGAVKAPVLMVSAEGDETVRIESARELYRILGSVRKEYHLLGPDVPHILTTPENPRRRETFSLVLDFLLSLKSNSMSSR